VMLTHNYLLEVLEYDKYTGIFTWVKSKRKSINGKTAGTIHHTGYLYISINRTHFSASRLALFYVFGEWPEYDVDHVNGIKTDNRLCNLRDVKTRVNCLNRYEHREGKLPGCYFKKDRKKWAAQIQISSKQKFLGYFESELDAHRRYMEELNNNGI